MGSSQTALRIANYLDSQRITLAEDQTRRITEILSVTEAQEQVQVLTQMLNAVEALQRIDESRAGQTENIASQLGRIEQPLLDMMEAEKLRRQHAAAEATASNEHRRSLERTFWEKAGVPILASLGGSVATAVAMWLVS